jgi:hypothetical protein
MKPPQLRYESIGQRLDMVMIVCNAFATAHGDADVHLYVDVRTTPSLY